MLRILESQAPAKQTATDTIATLCSRLQSATLLEDRRASILGLRSFAKQYPASVASGALRELITSLSRDADDPDTVKVVLETLLMLFSPDTNSAEASEEIALWLADEFSMRQDNIVVLLDLLDTKDFYSRLYALQLLSQISGARAERTQDTIFSAPLGLSRLVAILDDKREAIRNEGLLLLVALTPSSAELQKVVAFENAFDRIFSLIEVEGGLTRGTVVVQDCLSLLANLLRLNLSNQSFFRETGCISKLARLLADALKDANSPEGVPEWALGQRDMNVWGLLGILQLFLTPGSVGTSANQNTFWQTTILLQMLNLAFSPQFVPGLKAKALLTCADIIRGNASLQEKFGDLDVQNNSKLSHPTSKLTNGHASPKRWPKTNVIEALLNTTLEAAPSSWLDLRLAACECIKAFFAGHSGIRSHVLRRAIEGHKGGSDSIPNILTVLIDADGSAPADIYQKWFAAVLLLHLIFEDHEAKAIALAVSEGDASEGEEVVTCIQALASNLSLFIQKAEDERILIGYLMLLCGWTFEDPDAVNDFLGEASNLQSLLQCAKTGRAVTPLVPGLCALLLGIVYEFSSKDSPVPRSTIHNILISGLGREQYMDRLKNLRQDLRMRDFEVLPQTSLGEGDAYVVFDKVFVDFFKDNFSRILRAVDRDPGLEISVIKNGVEKGVSRELVDLLRSQLDDRTSFLTSLQSELLANQRQLEQEKLDHRKTRESSTVELSRVNQINEALQRNHENELQRLEEAHSTSRNDMLRQHQEQLRTIDAELKQFAAEKEKKAAKVRERNEAEIVELKSNVDQLQSELQKTRKDHLQDLQTAHDEYREKEAQLQEKVKRAEERLEEAVGKLHETQDIIKGLEGQVDTLKKELDKKESARKEVQTELDDLLIVFGDLEGKRAQDKKRLKDLGEAVSEGGDETDDEDEDDDEEEDGEVDDDID